MNASAAPGEVDASLLWKVTQFITAETQLLDDRRFEEWMELFSDDGAYWAPIAPDQADPFTHVSLFYDDKPTMKTRIHRLRHPKIFMQIPHSRTVHLTANVSLPPPEPGVIGARCSFIMLEYRPTRPQNVWGGRYDYHLIDDHKGSFKIRMKKATLVNSDDQFPSLALWF